MKNWIKLFTSAGSSGDQYWIRRLHTIALSGNGAALILLGTFMNKSDFPIQQIQASKQYFIPFIIGLVFALICAVTGVTTSRAYELRELMYSKSRELEDEIKQKKKDINERLQFDILANQEPDFSLKALNELKETFFSNGSELNKTHRNVFVAFTVMLFFFIYLLCVWVSSNWVFLTYVIRQEPVIFIGI